MERRKEKHPENVTMGSAVVGDAPVRGICSGYMSAAVSFIPLWLKQSDSTCLLIFKEVYTV